MPWTLETSRRDPRIRYYFHTETSETFCEVWERQESRSAKGFYYYRNVDTFQTSLEPPFPWKLIERINLADSKIGASSRYYYNQCSGETSEVKPELVNLRGAPTAEDLKHVPAQAMDQAQAHQHVPTTCRAHATEILAPASQLDEVSLAGQAQELQAKPQQEAAVVRSAALHQQHEPESQLSLGQGGASEKVDSPLSLAQHAQMPCADARFIKTLLMKADERNSTNDALQRLHNAAHKSNGCVLGKRITLETLSEAMRHLGLHFSSGTGCIASSGDSESSESSTGSESSVQMSWPTPEAKRRRVDSPTAVVAPKRRKKKKEVHPAHAAYSALSEAKKADGFWAFFKEAVQGERSANSLTQPFVLGGLSVLLPDVQRVCRKILVRNLEVQELLWQVMIVAYFGCGGPGFSTYNYFIGEGCIKDKRTCPKHARLPKFSLGESSLKPFYSHAASLANELGRDSLLAGDGTFTLMRFTEDQGLELLIGFHRALSGFLAILDANCDSSDRLDEHRRKQLEVVDPVRVRQHFLSKTFKGLGPLTVKEIYCYLNPVFPAAFPAHLTPWGPGALRGASLILGKKCTQSNVDQHVGRFVESMPKHIEADITESLSLLPAAVRQLPGINAQLQNKSATVLDFEVCSCWFQSYLRAVHDKQPEKAKAPHKWNAFRRDKWS